MKRLKEFRRSKGLTQKELAELMDITLSMYEKVERGKTGASAAFMRRLKRVFEDVDIEYIFFGTDSNNIAVDSEKKMSGSDKGAGVI